MSYYDGLFFGFDPVPQGALNIKSCNQSPQTWGQECLLTAQHIRKNSQGPLMVAFSGGIDSEVVCRAFLETDIEFNVFTLKYKDGSNEHDTAWADKFCKEFQLEQHVHYVDFDTIYVDFLQTMLTAGYRAHDLYRYLQLYIIREITNLGHVPVGGGGEQVYEMQDGVPGICLYRGFINACRYGQALGKTVWPYFFMTRPETVAAYLNESQIETVASGLSSLGLPISHEIKKQVYGKYFVTEDRPKYNGYEQNSESQKIIQDKLVQQIGTNVPFVSIEQLRNCLYKDLI